MLHKKIRPTSKDSPEIATQKMIAKRLWLAYQCPIMIMAFPFFRLFFKCWPIVLKRMYVQSKVFTV